MLSLNQINHIITSLLLFISSLFIVSCSSFLSGSVDDMIKDIGIEKLPSQEDYPEDDAVYLFNKYRTVVDYDQTILLVESVHKAMMLFKNIENYSEIALRFRGNEQIVRIDARIISPNGIITDLTEKDFFYSNDYASEGIFVSDEQTVKFVFPNVEKGSIIEYKYETKKIDDLFGSNRWYIQTSLPIVYNEYVLQTSKRLQTIAYEIGYDLNWNAKPYNYEFNTKPVYRHNNPKYTHTEWIIRNIPAFKTESKMPPPRNYLSYIQFAPVYWSKGWDYLSKTYFSSMFQQALNPDLEVIKNSKEIKEAASSELDRIKSSYFYTQEIRYVAIELGVGGYQPSLPSEVIQRGYGDCKDKAALLVALLTNMGIKAYPVLVLTNGNGSIDTKFPLMDFNHMIVKVVTEDKQVIWLDPTSEYAPFGILPWQDCGLDVLVINEDGSSYIDKTPSLNYEENLQHKNIDLTINAKDDAVFKIDFTFKGMENIYYRYILKDKTDEEKEKIFRAFLIDQFDDAKIADFYHDDIDNSDSEFNMGFTVEVKNAIQDLQDIYILTFDPLDTFSNTAWLAKDERIYPIEYNYPYVETENIKINIATDYLKIKTTPNNFHFDITDYRYKKNYKANDEKTLECSEYYAIKSKNIPAIRYTEIRDFYSVIKKEHSKNIVLMAK